ncbi:hypothetical protein L218DRAFT_989679 [Marasmius fiardii PR-910]|nr:hypothetical protein L218DRAFT_989679 [Marasmius fiardii PR-910]
METSRLEYVKAVSNNGEDQTETDLQEAKLYAPCYREFVSVKTKEPIFVEGRIIVTAHPEIPTYKCKGLSKLLAVVQSQMELPCSLPPPLIGGLSSDNHNCVDQGSMAEVEGDPDSEPEILYMGCKLNSAGGMVIGQAGPGPSTSKARNQQDMKRKRNDIDSDEVCSEVEIVECSKGTPQGKGKQVDRASTKKQKLQQQIADCTYSRTYVAQL